MCRYLVGVSAWWSWGWILLWALLAPVLTLVSLVSIAYYVAVWSPQAKAQADEAKAKADAAKPVAVAAAPVLTNPDSSPRPTEPTAVIPACAFLVNVAASADSSATLSGPTSLASPAEVHLSN